MVESFDPAHVIRQRGIPDALMFSSLRFRPRSANDNRHHDDYDETVRSTEYTCTYVYRRVNILQYRE